MKNYIQDGKTLELTAPVGGVESGEGYMVGGKLVVSHVDADAGEKFSAESEGVFEMVVDGVADFDEGEVAFWDDTAKAFKDSAAGYYGAAYCVEAVTAGATLGKFKLFNHPVAVVT